MRYKVKSIFNCSGNRLQNLLGSPEVVGFGGVNSNDVIYNCAINRSLVSLKGCPEKIHGSFYCSNTDIRDFMGGPKDIKNSFVAVRMINLRTLDGFPETIGRYLNIDITKLRIGSEKLRKELIQMTGLRSSDIDFWETI